MCPFFFLKRAETCLMVFVFVFIVVIVVWLFFNVGAKTNRITHSIGNIILVKVA